MVRLTEEEKTNKKFIQNMLNCIMYENLTYTIIPSGCNIEVRCLNLHTLEVVEQTLKDLYAEQQLASILGSIRVTYNHFVKD